MITIPHWPGLTGRWEKSEKHILVKEQKMELLKTLARKKKYLIWPVVILAAVVLLRLTLLAPPKVKVVKVERRDLTAQVYGNGTVEAKVVVGVSSKITGRIVELYADQGDQVKRGQLLARLENDDFIQQQRQSEAGVNRSAANLNVEQANLQKARANLALAEKNAQRFKTLAEKNLVSRLEAEQYENTCQVAREEVARSTAALEAARMEQAANRASLGFARSKVADTLIYAPQDGVIITRDLEKGATVTPGMSIFTLADPATVWVKANVDESQLKGVAVGKKAIITLRSSPGEQFPGQVARLGRQSDRVTEELEVDVAFTPPLKNFRLGEQSDVYIVTEARKDVPSLPSAALVTKEKKRGVWVVENGRLKFKAVTVGIEDRRNFTEIVTGLDGSERVVVAPPPEMAKFRDGMKVRMRNESCHPRHTLSPGAVHPDLHRPGPAPRGGDEHGRDLPGAVCRRPGGPQRHQGRYLGGAAGYERPVCREFAHPGRHQIPHRGGARRGGGIAPLLPDHPDRAAGQAVPLLPHRL